MSFDSADHFHHYPFLTTSTRTRALAHNSLSRLPTTTKRYDTMTKAQTSRPGPPRPSRSVERLTIHTSNTPSSPPPLPSTPPSSFPTADNTSSPDSPSVQTPTTPTQSYYRHGHRKSINSIRRKPVPLTPDEFGLELSNLQSNPDGHSSTPSTPTPNPTTSSSAPPYHPYSQSVPSYSHSHVLLVDPPVYPHFGDDPFRTPQQSATTSRATLPDFDMGIHSHGHGQGSRPSGEGEGEELPTYAIETQTEPATLARGLWRIGFVVPILWIIGMCM